MKAKELRIGNLCHYHVADILDDPPERDVVNTIDYDDIRILFRYEDGNFKPIPLTEEWLLRFGFDGMFSGAGYHKDGVEIGLNHNGYYVISTGFKIEYVHQLQNLYFALTGEELTVKE